MIEVGKAIRLREVERREFKKALPWYQDVDIQYNVNGIKHPYELDMVIRMFDFLTTHGNVYFIEVLENHEWQTIGDVSLLQGTVDDLPITIGDKNYWGKGIGKQVVSTLIEEARKQNRQSLQVQCYDFNERSIRLYQSLGFKQSNKTELGHVYTLQI